MTEWRLGVKISKRASAKAKEELEKLERVYFSWEDIEMMLRRGLKSLPTIVYTASYLNVSSIYCPWPKLSQQYVQEIGNTFESLRQRVKVWIVRSSDEPDVARWPYEVLDLKEVQNEICWLREHDLMSKSDPNDREIGKAIALQSGWNREFFKDWTLDMKIDYEIDGVNSIGKKFVDCFSKATEIHKKYPKSRFWFYTVFE